MKCSFKLSIRLVALACLSSALLVEIAQAGIVFSEDFEGITPTPTDITTTNSAFTTSVASSGSPNVIQAVPDTTPIFSAPNQYLQFVDDSGSSPLAAGPLTVDGVPAWNGGTPTAITGGFQLDLDFYDADGGDSSTRLLISDDGNGTNPSNGNGLAMKLGDDGSIISQNGSAHGDDNTVPGVFQSQVAYHLTVIGNVGADPVIYSSPDGDIQVDQFRYNVWIDDGVNGPVRVDNDTDHAFYFRESTAGLSPSSLVQFEIRANNNAGHTSFNFDNIVLQDAIVGVPEPSGLILIGMGVLGLVSMRKVRSHRIA